MKEEINQQWVDNLKKQPIRTQVLEILKILNSNIDVSPLRPMLIQFSDLLRDIKIANRNTSNDGDFYQNRIEEVMSIRGLSNKQ